jgi:uncharacterized protein YjbI with pentapeptide repeats
MNHMDVNDQDKIGFKTPANQAFIVVGISAAFVGVIVLIYSSFRFNWSLWVLILLMLIGTLLLVLLIHEGYRAQWTGFSDKKGWDWIVLVITFIGAIAVPLSIIFGLYTFTIQQQDDNSRTQQQNETNARLADAQQQEITLQTYLDDMTTLLFADKLGDHAPTSAEAAVIARSKTLIALNRLTDPQRKAEVVQFLYESNLIGYYDYTKHTIQPPIVELHGANLEHANLSYANLRYANLSSTDLRYANLSSTDLRYVNLNGTNFGHTTLSGALLSGADLSKANLAHAIITSAQLAQAQSLQGATMPDGEKHP